MLSLHQEAMLWNGDHHSNPDAPPPEPETLRLVGRKDSTDYFDQLVEFVIRRAFQLFDGSGKQPLLIESFGGDGVSRLPTSAIHVSNMPACCLQLRFAVPAVDEVAYESIGIGPRSGIQPDPDLDHVAVEGQQPGCRTTMHPGKFVDR